MSAPAVLLDIMKKQAAHTDRCVACGGPPEVYFLGRNWDGLVCMDCTKKYVQIFLENNYSLWGGDQAKAFIVTKTEERMTGKAPALPF